MTAPPPLIRSASNQKLIQDLATWRADGFANADFAGALFHGDQHDVHDADAADEQRDKGDHQKDDGQRERNIFRGAEDRGERLHVVFGAGRMAAVENCADAGARRRRPSSARSAWA